MNINEPTAKKLIESAPGHILNMSHQTVGDNMVLIFEKFETKNISDSISMCKEFKISIDWVGDECVCYPFQNVHTPTLGEQATLLSISDRNPRIAIAKAVIWQQEVLAKSN